MEVRVVHFDDLEDRDADAWLEIVRSNSQFWSPYFHPEFSRSVHAARGDVCVAVMRERGESRGFFPFHRDRWRGSRPVGGALSDYHGVIVVEGTDWNVPELFRASSISSFRFDHLLSSQPEFAEYRTKSSESPVIDLTEGFDVYAQRKRQEGAKWVSKTRSAANRLSKKLGELEFVAHAPDDEEAFQKILEWKTRQCLACGGLDMFSFEWTRKCVDVIRRADDHGFSGTLSTLRAGGRLVAAHLGMRSPRVWHYWFPGYDRDFSTLSPGSVLLLEMMRLATEWGISTIDLGKGQDAYKQRVMTGVVPICEGSVELHAVSRLASGLYQRYSDWSAERSERHPLRLPVRLVERIRRARRYR